MNKKVLILGIILAVIGSAVIVFSLLPRNAERQQAIDTWNQLNNGEGKEIQGTVVDSDSQTKSEGTRRSRSIVTVYCPVYEYTVAGTAYRATAVGDDCLDDRENVINGETTTLLYDPANPGTAFVKSDASANYYSDSKGSLFVGIGAGLFIALIGVACIATARPKTPEQIAKQEELRRKNQAEYERLVAELEERKNKK